MTPFPQKTAFFIISALLIGASMPAASAYAQVSNLIGNPSLETASGAVPSGWSSGVWGTTKASFSYPSGGAHTGTRYAKTQITAAGTGDAKWFPGSVSVTPGSSYTFSEWYQSSVSSEIDLEYTLSTGSKSYAVIGSPAVSAASWSQFQASFIAPANAASLKIFHLIEATGTLSIDDFSLTTSAAPVPPVLAQVTPVATSTKDTTPDYTFSSTRAGTISYAGDCKSSKTAAVAGNTTVTFTALAQGLHSNCTISVKDASGGISNTLAVPSFTVDTTKPAVTINQSAEQADPATTLPVLFGAVFSEPVSDFAAADVAISGTAAGTKTITVSGSGTTYVIEVSGMSGSGTVIAAIPAGVAHDAAGNASTAATFTDRTVTYTKPAATSTQVMPVPVSLLPSSLASGTTSVAYSQPLTASTSASGPFTWSIASGALPPGITLSTPATLSSSLSGTPTASGTFNFSVKVTNGTSSTTNMYSLVVAPAATSTNPSNLIPNGDMETANGTAPANWHSSYWGTLTPVFSYPVAGNGGGKAAQVQITKYTEGDAKWVFNLVTVSSHTIYQYSEDYSANATTNVTIEYKKTDGSYDYEWVGDLPATSGWSSYSTQITVPTGVVSFTVLHVLPSVGMLAVDNAKLTAQPASPFASGMASMVFDDGLASQYTYALPIMNAAGFKGSYYIITSEPASGDTGYMTWSQIKSLASSSQEIGAHTRTHPYLTTLSPADLQSEVAGSYSDLAAQGLTPATFVYPYGDLNSTVENAVKSAGFTGARGSDFGLNSTLADPYNLYDIRLDANASLSEVESLIDQAAEDKRWIVFEIHDVVKNGGGDYAITPAFFQSVVTYLQQKNVPVVTLSQGIAQLSH